MKNLLLLELKKLRYPYLIGLVLSLLYCYFAIQSVRTGYHYNYNIEVWIEAGGTFALFFPLFAVIPTCWIMYFERKNNFITYSINRVSKTKFLLNKWLVTSIGGAFIVFFVSIVGLLYCLYIIPDIQPTHNDFAMNNFAGYYFVNKPLLYGLLLCFWKSVIGMLIATLGFVLSLFVNNIFLILTGPFVYCVLENFILSILGVPYFRLVTSFDPNNLSPAAISYNRLMVGPLLLIIFITIILCIFVFPKKEQVYQI